MKSRNVSKKVRSEAEIKWRQESQDKRWERREEYLMRQFSAPSCLLPRQIADQKAQERT